MEIRSVKRLSSNEMESVIRVQIIGEIASVSILNQENCIITNLTRLENTHLLLQRVHGEEIR